MDDYLKTLRNILIAVILGLTLVAIVNSAFGAIKLTTVNDSYLVSAKIKDCKDKLVCDPNDPCYDPNHSDFWMCDPNYSNCNGKLECDPTKKCYFESHPDFWMCFYENNPTCDPNIIMCDMSDDCFNPDYPDLYELCTDPNCLTAVFLKGEIVVTIEDDMHVVKWTTAQEVDNFGFYVYRSIDGECMELISKLIRGSMSLEGRDYLFYVEPVEFNESCCYYIEDIDYYGIRTIHPPVCIEVIKRVYNNESNKNVSVDISLKEFLPESPIKRKDKEGCFINQF